jgi:uncharacterized protein (TIGR02246 family)
LSCRAFSPFASRAVLRGTTRWLGLLLPVCLASCAGKLPGPDPASVAAAQAQIADTMERYQRAARTTNPDLIAAFYTPTGVLLEPGISPVHGREAIRAFIASFPGVRVDVATATPDEIEVWDGRALLWGSYFERLAFPGQPESEQHGKFVIRWARQPDGAWLIQRFYRIPIATSEPMPR